MPERNNVIYKMIEAKPAFLYEKNKKKFSLQLLKRMIQIEFLVHKIYRNRKLLNIADF